MNRFNYLNSFRRPKIFAPLLEDGKHLRSKRDGEIIVLKYRYNENAWYAYRQQDRPVSAIPVFIMTQSVLESEYEPI